MRLVVSCEAPGHDDGHRPVHLRLVVSRTSLVVADYARDLVIQDKVRSTTQRRGSTTNLCCSVRLTIWRVSRGLSFVLAQVTSLPA
jgi:hypothetical protein